MAAGREFAERHMVADMTEPMQFIKVADANLYKAKKNGRNQVVAG